MSDVLVCDFLDCFSAVVCVQLYLGLHCLGISSMNQSWTWVGSIHGSGRVEPFVWVCVDYTKCYAMCNCKVYTIY